YVGLGLKYHNTHIKPTIDPKLHEGLFKFSQYNNYDIELYAHYNYNSMNKVLFATQGAILKGFLGRALYSNLNLEFSDEAISDFNGKVNGFTRFGIDYEKRFLLSEKITTI